MISESFTVILLGLVEGITEFLPISSTAHLLITEHYLDHTPDDAFNIIIQLGAVLAVVVIYWRRLLDFVINISKPEQRDYILKLAAALTITIVGCLVAKKMGFKLPTDLWPLVVAMLGGAVAIFLAEWLLKKKPVSESLTWHVVVWVAFAQILAAVFPGTSRSGATIIAAMFCGLSRPAATEFSFLLGIPTMFAASIYAGKEAWDTGIFDSPDTVNKLVVGFIISMMTAFVVVKWLIHYVRSNTFIPFAWYRVFLSIVLIIALWNERTHLPPDLKESLHKPFSHESSTKLAALPEK